MASLPDMAQRGRSPVNSTAGLHFETSLPAMLIADEYCEENRLYEKMRRYHYEKMRKRSFISD
jgi:hypothetical protein